MDPQEIIEFLEQGNIGLTISVEESKVLEIKVIGNNVDVNILDLQKFGKLKEEYKRWRG